ncbi:MAG: NADPH-dependent oxidoreductase [candidate division Zixibacteria bacterium]|nr:NADPH-dependent oxidoreductase [candidate division Zixibacteria bacterium]
MNDVLTFLNSHASVRAFENRDISPDDEQTILATAERSPTSSNLHAYSIISIRDQEKKQQLAEWSGNQAHVAACPLFLVFCADLYRLSLLTAERGYDFCGEYTEAFIVATVDAALAAGRALQAAQALDMGGVMVGGIRNNPSKVSDLLKLPEMVYPVMGMSLGYPVAAPKVKPRLPLPGLAFAETYQIDQIAPAVAEYDRIIDDVGHLRHREVEKDRYPDYSGPYSWSEHSARRMASNSPNTLRPHMLEYLRERGLLRR